MKANATITAPSIDAAEVAWATEELADIIRRVPPDSVVGKVLSRTAHELASLKQSAPGTVFGPFRVRAVAA